MTRFYLLVSHDLEYFLFSESRWLDESFIEKFKKKKRHLIKGDDQWTLPLKNKLIITRYLNKDNMLNKKGMLNQQNPQQTDINWIYMKADHLHELEY